MKYNKIRDVLNESCKNILGYKENKRNDWIRDTTWKNILERRNLKVKTNARKTRSEKAKANKEYQSRNKEVKKMIRNDKRKYIEQLADKAQEAASLGNIKELYEKTKLLSQRNWVRNKPIKDKQGVLITNEEEQSQRLKEHFQEVLNDHGDRQHQTTTRRLTLTLLKQFH
jgi:hypothetical protein